MTTPLTWITDRPPTEADGNFYGDVRVLIRPDEDYWEHLHWRFVKVGVPWQRTYRSVPPTATPEPTTPTLQPRRIVSIAEAESTAMAVADDGTAWYLRADWSGWEQLPALPDREC